MRALILAIMLLWAMPALAFFTSFSVNGSGSPTPPPSGTPTYYIYGF